LNSQKNWDPDVSKRVDVDSDSQTPATDSEQKFTWEGFFFFSQLLQFYTGYTVLSFEGRFYLAVQNKTNKQHHTLYKNSKSVLKNCDKH
jgi:hypothetical protein